MELTTLCLVAVFPLAAGDERRSFSRTEEGSCQATRNLKFFAAVWKMRKRR